MLEFMLKAPKRFLNDIVTLAPPPGKGNSRRALTDRRAPTPTGVPSSVPRKRRRHDGFNSVKPTPLEW